MTAPGPTGFVPCPLDELLREWAGGLRFAGLPLVPYGDDEDDIAMITPGHVGADEMIAACRSYQRYVDQGKPGPVRLAWERARADWRFCRLAGPLKTRLSRRAAAASVIKSTSRRTWLAVCPTTRLRWPGPEAVGLTLAAVVPGCPYEDDDVPGHGPGCNCDGPWIRVGRHLRPEDRTAAALVTVIDWHESSLRCLR